MQVGFSDQCKHRCLAIVPSAGLGAVGLVPGLLVDALKLGGVQLLHRV